MNTWPERLAQDHPGRMTALEELRSVLFRGLQAGLSGRAGSDSAFIEDIVQEALLRILDRLDTFQQRSQFTSWALSIAFRVAFNELRRREWKNLSLEALQGRQGTLLQVTDTSACPDLETERRQLASLVKKVIESDLTPRQRDVLLCELSGMPQEEIARQLDTNRNNVYKLFHDARKALKRALEALGHDAHTLLGYESETNRDEFAQ